MLAAQQLQQQAVPVPGAGAGTMRTAAGAKAAADPAQGTEDSSMRGRWPPVALHVNDNDGTRASLTGFTSTVQYMNLFWRCNLRLVMYIYYTVL